VISPTLFDSHLHLTAGRFDGDRSDVITRARVAGVTQMVTIASTPEDARLAVSLAERTPGVWATAGLHPHEASRISETLLGELKELTERNEVVAVGETGLDFHYDHSPRDIQFSSFREHLDLAADVHLPIIVHSRSAEEETARLVAEYGDRVSGVLHCFSGGEELLQTAVDMGWYISFSGLLTFVDELESLVEKVPLNQILIETDAPYLAPSPKRGRRNEPSFLPYICERLAKIRDTSFDDIVMATTENACRFYHLRDNE
jgi:TatD DNase family protein